MVAGGIYQDSLPRLLIGNEITAHSHSGDQ